MQKYFQKKHCFLNKYDILKDGGIAACQKKYDEKKKKAFLIDGNYYKIVGIVSTKINTLIKYQLLNGAIA